MISYASSSGFLSFLYQLLFFSWKLTALLKLLDLVNFVVHGPAYVTISMGIPYCDPYFSDVQFPHYQIYLTTDYAVAFLPLSQS